MFIQDVLFEGVRPGVALAAELAVELLPPGAAVVARVLFHYRLFSEPFPARPTIELPDLVPRALRVLLTAG